MRDLKCESAGVVRDVSNSATYDASFSMWQSPAHAARRSTCCCAGFERGKRQSVRRSSRRARRIESGDRISTSIQAACQLMEYPILLTVIVDNDEKRRLHALSEPRAVISRSSSHDSVTALKCTATIICCYQTRTTSKQPSHQPIVSGFPRLARSLAQAAANLARSTAQLRDLIAYTPESPDSVAVVCYDSVARLDLCGKVRFKVKPRLIARTLTRRILAHSSLLSTLAYVSHLRR